MPTARSARAILVAVCLLGLIGSVAYVGWFRHVMADAQLTVLLSADPDESYVGVQEITTFDGGQEQKSRVGVHRKGRRERLEYVTGPAEGSVLIDDGQRLLKLDPAQKAATECLSERKAGYSSLFSANYRARAHRGAEVTGRWCKALKIEPHRHIGPTRILWFDPPAGAGRILKREDYNTSGLLASRSEFVEIDYDKSVNDSVFEVPSDYEVREAGRQTKEISLSDAEEALGFDPLIPSYVPKGYELDRVLGVTTKRGRRFLQIEYFDGLNRISVVEGTRGGGGGHGLGRGPGMGPGPNGGGRHMGGAPGQGGGPGRRLRAGWMKNRMAGACAVQVGEVSVSVIGDLPPEELQKIADSIQ